MQCLLQSSIHKRSVIMNYSISFYITVRKFFWLVYALPWQPVKWLRLCIKRVMWCVKLLTVEHRTWRDRQNIHLSWQTGTWWLCRQVHDWKHLRNIYERECCTTWGQEWRSYALPRGSGTGSCPFWARRTNSKCYFLTGARVGPKFLSEKVSTISNL